MTLTEARRAAGLTLEAMASRLGCSKSHLSEIENGKKSASLRLAARIVELLPNVAMTDLIAPDAPAREGSAA